MNRREALQALVSLPAVARISVAELKPDDVLVIECEGRVSAEQANRIKETLGQVWPGRKAVVFDEGMRLRIVAAGKAQS
jgi:hypothetical protein